jgi:hypothetical protein
MAAESVSMLINWLVYPLLLTLACAGHGLVARRLFAVASGALLLPLGFASVIVLSTLTIASPLHAVPWLALVVPAVAGWALGGRELIGEVRARHDLWPPAGAALLAFLAYGAPVLLSGELTFSGYSQIVDIAHHFSYPQWLIDHWPV